jgi:hypothetical protein
MSGKVIVIIKQGIVWESYRSPDVDLTIIDLDEVSALDTLGYAGVDRNKIDKYESLMKRFGFSEDEAFKVYLNDILHENPGMVKDV